MTESLFPLQKRTQVLLFPYLTPFHLDLQSFSPISPGPAVTETYFSYQTALHRAVLVDSQEIAELLISRGAELNTGDRDGVTPLALANRWDALQRSVIVNS